MLRDRSELSAGFWSYIDVYDLADAMVLAAESDLPGHEVFYIASPDNVGGRPFEAAVREHYGDQVEVKTPLFREDSSGISIEKARRMLGYDPKRSWRDYLDEDGRLEIGRHRAIRRLERPTTPRPAPPSRQWFGACTSRP